MDIPTINNTGVLMPKPHYPFGGDWTSEKLERVRKYLVAYAAIMSKQRFRFAYIDAFAGSGYRSQREEPKGAQSLLPEFDETDSRAFIDGSARIALQVSPRFNKYILLSVILTASANSKSSRMNFRRLGKI